MDRSKFTVSVINKSNGIEIVNHTLETSKIGLNKLSVNETFGTVKLNISSKILGNDYEKGITLNTLDNVINNISQCGIKLDINFINDSTVNRIDVKNDLRLTKETEEYINSLNNLTASKFVKTKYPTGITFNELQKTNPLRCTFYDKEYEVSNDKSLYKLYPKLLNDLDHILRMETRLSKRGTIKKVFKTSNLVEVLKTKDVNFGILKKIVNNQNSIKPIFNTKTMTNTQEKNFAQVYYLNELYHGDFDSIIGHIKNKLGKNTKATYQRKQVKKYLDIINNEKSKDIISDIDELLCALI